MDLRHIQEFVVLAEVCNYTKAADFLYTTQATLSRHIVSLESELGHPLFYRTTKKVELTEFGKQFLPYAQNFVETLETCQMNLLSGKNIADHHLVIGASELSLRLPAIEKTILHFIECHPEIAVETVCEETASRLMLMLKEGKCNAIFLRESLAAKDSFQRIPIDTPESLYVLLPKTHPLAGQKSASLYDMKDELFLPPPEGTNACQQFIQHCRQAGFEPRIRFTMRNLENVQMMAQTGIGIPIVSGSRWLSKIGNDVSLVEISPQIQLVLNLVYPLSGKKSNLLAELAKLFQK